MRPDRVSIPGPLAYESDALPTALSGPAASQVRIYNDAMSLLSSYHSALKNKQIFIPANCYNTYNLIVIQIFFYYQQSD